MHEVPHFLAETASHEGVLAPSEKHNVLSFFSETATHAGLLEVVDAHEVYAFVSETATYKVFIPDWLPTYWFDGQKGWIPLFNPTGTPHDPGP